MAATPISAAQATCLRLASTRALDAARELLNASERRAFDIEEGLTLIFETLGAVAVGYPRAEVHALIRHAVTNSGFGLSPPEQPNHLAAQQ
ncbi:hypothetical protein [Lichenifustis flavocetrariae]|uniref:Uncharacterized protein n=1 Tax=Lichenifustis flavocetrariae TaxID=2949735 RepID=A0AA41Z1R6_9HYPH|nr:hypothetical protein [Lichenifustis flavocetrariae]MCW6512614.1 hypothetical protein [Lichenifustis flavocetrariae]